MKRVGFFCFFVCFCLFVCFFDTQFCIFSKQKCSYELSFKIVTVPKRYFNHSRYNGIQPLNSTPRLTLILRFCMPKNAHTHEWYCISVASRSKKKKKIDLQTLMIFRPRGQTNLLFFWEGANVCVHIYKHHASSIWSACTLHVLAPKGSSSPNNVLSPG